MILLFSDLVAQIAMLRVKYWRFCCDYNDDISL